MKNSIFENFYKCFDPFCMGKNWFWDFESSGWIWRFWAFFKKFWDFFEKIYFWKKKVFWPILYGKKILNFRFSIFWMNHKNLLKIFTSVIFLTVWGNFQKWIFSKKAQNFLKNAQNLLIHPEDWKSQNQFFPIQNGSKHL